MGTKSKSLRCSHILADAADEIIAISGLKNYNAFHNGWDRTFLLDPHFCYFAVAVASLPKRKQDAVDHALIWNMRTRSACGREWMNFRFGGGGESLDDDPKEGMHLANEMIKKLLAAHAEAMAKEK
jgi:hypothetical protein